MLYIHLCAYVFALPKIAGCERFALNGAADELGSHREAGLKKLGRGQEKHNASSFRVSLHCADTVRR